MDYIRAVGSLRRFVVVWLVAIALPVQCVAGVLGLHCASMMTGTDHAAHATPSAQAVDATSAADPARAGHEHHHAAHAVDAGPSSAADGAPAQATGSHACSACAMCCVGAALPASMPELALPEPSSLQPSFAAATPASVVPGGLERPPRTTFA
jgi:hypothetical protein